MDSGLDHGLDYGPTFGLNFGLDFGLTWTHKSCIPPLQIALTPSPTIITNIEPGRSLCIPQWTPGAGGGGGTVLNGGWQGLDSKYSG